MVRYLKEHFFVRYRSFESWAHLNQQLKAWLHAEADQRVHGTVHEVVADRFTRELPHLTILPTMRYDTAYYTTRKVGWDGYINVRGNRVPSYNRSTSQRCGECVGTLAAMTASQRVRPSPPGNRYQNGIMWH